MKKAFALIGLVAISALSACSYGGVASEGGKAIVLRNDMVLFGLLRKVYVCKVDAGGLSNCNTSVNP